MQDLKDWLVVIRAPGLGAGCACEALGRFGGPAALCAAGAGSWRSAGLNAETIAWLQQPDQALIDADLRWCDQTGHHLVPRGSALWPALLEEIPDPPLALFVAGDPAALSLPQLAMVGSRNPTTSGADTARAFATHLSSCGLAITSGMARGIDAASHQGAIAAGGVTIAVAGTGLDRPYPTEHAALAQQIAATGAVVSEFPPGTPPRRQNFPQRNRLISGLSIGTLVVEAAIRSGSLITARCAMEQGREVFAIPGSIHNPLSRGCHRLIRDGAKLVESGQDVFDELGALARSLGVLGEHQTEAGDGRPAALAIVSGEEDPDYETLRSALGFDPVSLDILVSRSGLTAEAVSSMLLILELGGEVETAPGGRYVRTGRRPAKS